MDGDERRLSPDLERQIAILIRQMAEPPPDLGHLAPDRWLTLPAHQREWLTGKSKAELDRIDIMMRIDPAKLDAVIRLGSEDIDDLKEAVQFARSVRVVGRFGRAMLMAVFGAFATMVLFGQQLQVAWKWVTGAAK